MDLPTVRESDFTEIEGINHVANVVNRARCVWRELLKRDIGIDGHIEYITSDGLAPGRLIAVQVKSGVSRFDKVSETEVTFYPDEKHRQYWAEYPLPVVLILHNPMDKETVWVDVREALRIQKGQGPIQVPRNQLFDPAGVTAALSCDGPLPTGHLDIDAILQEMVISDNSAQGLCFLYLFAQGMTDIAYSLYFSMDLFREVLDVLSSTWNPPRFGIGSSEYDFIDRYVDFLIRYDLARIDYGSWKQIKFEREMVGTFIAPLTQKGIAVREAISEVDSSLPPTANEVFPQYSKAIQERFIQMLFNPMGHDEFQVRQHRIDVVRTHISKI